MPETSETAALSQAQVNPLLKAWQTPFETPPFAEIVPEHFLPAFEQAFADHSAEVAAIMRDDGITILTSVTLDRVEGAGGGRVAVDEP